VTPHAHRHYLSPPEPPREPLATPFIGGAALVLVFFFLCFLLPVMT
jgi:hypothetical protein